MAFVNYKATNTARSTLASGITDSDLSLVLNTGEGALFPSAGDFFVTLEKLNASSEVTQREIVKCTARSTDTLTIVRSAGTCVQDDTASTKASGTTAYAFAADDRVSLYITDEDIEDLKTEIATADNTTNTLHKTGTETASGDKTLSGSNSWTGSNTFTSHPDQASYTIPTLDAQYVPKKYIDDQIAISLLPTIFGDGSDGALVVSSGTTNINLDQTYNYSSISISAGATLGTSDKVGEMKIKCTGTATIDGTIDASGSGDHTKDAVSGLLKVTVTAGASGAGGAGGDGGDAGSGTKSGGTGGTTSGPYGGGGGGGACYAGAVGFDGGDGGAGGTPAGTGGAGANSANGNPGGTSSGGGGSGVYGNAVGGDGGDAYGSNGSIGNKANETIDDPAAGGGGGAGGEALPGGILYLYSATFAGSGTINCNGLNGLDGGDGGDGDGWDSSDGAAGGGGGGAGGGGGGAALLVGNTNTFGGSITVAAGSGGTGGAAGTGYGATEGVASAGSNGAAGSAGSSSNVRLKDLI